MKALRQSRFGYLLYYASPEPDFPSLAAHHVQLVVSATFPFPVPAAYRISSTSALYCGHIHFPYSAEL